MRTLPQPDLSRKRGPSTPKAEESLEMAAESVKMVTAAGTKDDAGWSGGSRSGPQVETGEDARQQLLQARVRLQFQLPMVTYMLLMIFSSAQPDRLLLIQRRMMVPHSPQKRECWSLVQGAGELKMEGKEGTYDSPIFLDSEWLEGLGSLPRPLERDKAEAKMLIFDLLQFPAAHSRGRNELRTRKDGVCQAQLGESSIQDTPVTGRMVVRYRRAAQLLKNRRMLNSRHRPLFKESEDQLEAISWAGPITEPLQISVR